jgi:glycosyltransferase involved in cell wall biosynthesis
MWRLSRSELLDCVVYVEQPLTLLSLLKFLAGRGDEDARYRWRRVLRCGFVTKMKPREVYVLTPLTIPLWGSGWLYGLDLTMRSWVEVFLVRRALKRFRRREALLWVSHPFLPAATPRRLGGDLVCYDCTEEFSQFMDFPEYARRRFSAADGAFMREARVALVVSDYLLEKRRHLRPDAIRLPNAVDPGLARPGEIGEPGDLSGIRRPRLISVGGINGSYDWDLVEYLVRARPDWSLVFIGPVSIGRRRRRRLDSFPQIHFLGRRPHALLGCYLQGADVCLQLYRATDANRSRNAQKLLLYLASGKPVVSTPTGNVERLEGYVSVAGTNEEFVRLVGEALECDTLEARNRRLDEAKRHSWDERVRTVEDLLRTHVGVTGCVTG